MDLIISIHSSQMRCCQHPQFPNAVLSASAVPKCGAVSIRSSQMRFCLIRSSQMRCCQHPQFPNAVLSAPTVPKCGVISIHSSQMRCCQHPQFPNAVLSYEFSTRPRLQSGNRACSQEMFRGEHCRIQNTEYQEITVSNRTYTKST